MKMMGKASTVHVARSYPLTVRYVAASAALTLMLLVAHLL